MPAKQTHKRFMSNFGGKQKKNQIDDIENDTTFIS